MIVEERKETNLGMVDEDIVEEDQPFVKFHIRRYYRRGVSWNLGCKDRP